MPSIHIISLKPNTKVLLLVSFLILFVNTTLVNAQYTIKKYANHQTTKRRVITTEHFKIVYPSAKLEFATKTGRTAEQIFKAYKQLLDVDESFQKITLYIGSEKKFISRVRALNTESVIPLWQKNRFFKCFKSNQPEWKYLLRYEIAYVFLQAVKDSKLGMLQAFLMSSPSATLWSSGMPAYLSAPFLTKCDVRFLKDYWNVEKRAKKKINYSTRYSETMLGRSQVHFFNKTFSADLLKSLYGTYKSFAGVKYYDFNYAFLKTFGVPYFFFFNQWKRQQFKIYNKSDSLPEINYTVTDTIDPSKSEEEFKIQSSSSRPYHSFFNIDVALPIVLPYYLNPDEWGIGGLLRWQSPLRLHKFMFAGVLSIPSVADRSFFYTKYVNNSLGPRLELAFKHYAATSDWLDLTIKQSNTVALSLLSRIDTWSSEYSNWYAGFMLRYMNIDYFSPWSTGKSPSNIVFDNKRANQTDLRLILAWRKLLPTNHNSVHPLNGRGFRISITGSSPFLNAETQYARFYSEAFTLIPTVGKQRIYLYTAGAFDIDEPIGADYLYFSDDGDYEMPEPKLLGPMARGVEGYIRGYDHSIVGERFAMGTLEYRIPLTLNSRKLFGVLPLPKTALSLFADGGIIGNASSPRRIGFTEYRFSLGAEIKTALSFEGYSIVFNVGVAQALEQNFAPLIYFNIQPAIPF